MENPSEKQTVEVHEEKLPPFVSSWGQFYFFVMAELAILIGLFYWFSIAYA